MTHTSLAQRVGTFAVATAIGVGALTGAAGTAQAASLSGHSLEAQATAPVLTVSDSTPTVLALPLATTRSDIHAASFQAASNPLANAAKKTGAFAACIFGVGVPIGLVWGIASNPQVWAYVLGLAPLPASVGGNASKYMSTIKRACAYALR